MTREETINVLKTLQDMYRVNTYVVKSIDMAIEALQAEPTKAVPPSLADVYKWERDIALSQLEEYGIGFAEKKRDDLVEVVRCGSCKNLSSDGKYNLARLLMLHMALKDCRNESNHASSKERATIEEVKQAIYAYVELTKKVIEKCSNQG